MLVYVAKTFRQPGSEPWAVVRSAIGGATVRWSGGAGGGLRRVEWTIDADVTWGRDARPARSAAPAIGTAGPRVLLRGRLGLAADGAAHLLLAGTPVLLDFLGPPPPRDAAGTWIELGVEAHRVRLYPYEV
ncbi:hypothetical protein [Marinitenerispora sediminis]|uniref:Uncharacterized protein n=1 Tax=Marinitenerispora sediminis TaxID=1931232 RepID=A0A368T5W8_9ACTN|nr:hypothetical protein [Marinitenerispora sediminis]RCV51709.1 hypothetical protein DEF28_14765 [Marinitenerispora sediminis]RCV55092.1 hypothetical protein DEF23_14750 [Marinitenerispora sediminis]RCV59093.1 hypothetical protein DEF24_11095 [Marinitenerispora sediminis]